MAVSRVLNPKNGLVRPILSTGSLLDSLSVIWIVQKRWMTKSRRVQDRSKLKRVHDLEIATERWKVASKVLFLMDVLNKEPEQVIPLRGMEKYRQQISLNKPHKVSDFIAKSPKLFELYRDKMGVTWCGLTEQAACLMEEENMLLDGNKDKAAEYVTRLLMMSVNRRLALEKIAFFRRDLGLPWDFRKGWVNRFPELFRVVVNNNVEHLELVSWNPDWAVTELEKRALVENGAEPHQPGILSLPFLLKFPPDFKKIFRVGGKIDHFQKTSYLSPYADASDLVPGSQESDKRAVAIMHEVLSFMIEKRLVTDHLTHFRQEFVMPQKLMRLLLKHFGIFYVSERGKRFHVFLTEAYDGSELIEKSPLVLWKEKILRLTGYRGKKRGIKRYDEFSDVEEYGLYANNDNSEITFDKSDHEEMLDGLDDFATPDEDVMEAKEVYNAYKNNDLS